MGWVCRLCHEQWNRSREEGRDAADKQSADDEHCWILCGGLYRDTKDQPKVSNRDGLLASETVI
jgi:hypothetical protein